MTDISTETYTPPPHKTASSEKIHLNYLDGIRGLAAFYVMITHAYLLSTPNSWQHLPKLTFRQTIFANFYDVIHYVFQFGMQAVACFIVLSGYVLMLPLARKQSFELPAGFIFYIKRRARRILPPYYASLILSLLLILITPLHHNSLTWQLPSITPAFSKGVLVSHLFLFHNLRSDWIYKINGPLWSVATEWQIYFVFPLILLPLCKRIGIFLTVVGALLVTILPYYISPYMAPHIFDTGFTRFWLAHPWYIGLFGLGMLAACINFNVKFSRYQNIPYTLISIIALIPFIYIGVIKTSYYWNFTWLCDICVGLSTACIIIQNTKKRVNHETTLLLNILDSKPIMKLGTFSYSLYLTHFPILCLSFIILSEFHVKSYMFIIYCAIVLPICIAGGYLFHLIFEKPFINTKPKEYKQV